LAIYKEVSHIESQTSLQIAVYMTLVQSTVEQLTPCEWTSTWRHVWSDW